MNLVSKLQKLALILNTVRDLKRSQVKYQLINRLRSNKNLRYYYGNFRQTAVDFLSFPYKFSSKVITGGNRFDFLNIPIHFEGEIDWNFKVKGKLWNYNLQYFDYLFQHDLPVGNKINLLKDNLKWLESGQLALEPYPVSLRVINTIRFVSREKIRNAEIEKGLFGQLTFLRSHLEQHLLGNHLLENGFALLIGGYYFNAQRFLDKGKEILFKQLSEQILPDGGHFELSPMYHIIILQRILESIELIRYNKKFIDDKFEEYLHTKATKMLDWMYTFSFSDSSFAMVNDAAPDIAPSFKEIKDYAGYLGLADFKKVMLKESGYRKFETGLFEGVFDVGIPGPSYQPGHAHADTFNIVMKIKGQDFLVDTGVSTYEVGERRMEERSTISHNTVTLEQLNSSEIWGSFRMGRKAQVIELVEGGNIISAKHDGYRKLGVFHCRTIEWYPQKFAIIDQMIGSKKGFNAILYFHFPPGFDFIIENNYVDTNLACFSFQADELIKISSKGYEFCTGFNKLNSAKKLEIRFNTGSLIRTEIKIK